MENKAIAGYKMLNRYIDIVTKAPSGQNNYGCITPDLYQDGDGFIQLLMGSDETFVGMLLDDFRI